MAVRHIVLLILALICFQNTNSYRWSGVTVDSSAWYELTNLDVTIIGKTSLIFAVLGCKGADLVFYQYVDSGSYVYLRLGDDDNNYSIMFANTHCDSNGCSPGGYEVASHLDCNAYKVFWAQWDNQGGFQVGHDNIIGENAFMYMNYNLNNDGVFNLRYAKISVNVDNVYVNWQFYIDNPPEISNPNPDGLTVTSLSEDSAIGSSVLAFTGTDLENDTLLWAELSSDSNKYTIDYTDDTLRTNATFDYEAQNYYSVVLAVFDGSEITNASFNMEIIDVDDTVPTLTINSDLTMLEEQPVDYKLGGFFVLEDPDSQTFTYTVSGTDEAFFKVNSDGVLQVKSRVDRESLGASTLTFTLNVTDPGGQTTSSDLNITVTDINDNIPSCDVDVYFVHVEEAGTGNVKVLDMACSDADSGDNAQVNANISDGNSAGVFSSTQFQIFADTSMIDYEALRNTNYTYYLSVDVYDVPSEGPANTGRITIVAEVTGKNEHAPTWTSPSPTDGKFPDVTVSEDAVPGTSLVTYAATDADDGIDGVVKYEIVSITSDTSASAPGTFHIVPETGELRVASTLDIDTGVSSYEIVVKAVDGGPTPQEVTATQKVKVDAANDNAPIFDTPMYMTAVDEPATVEAAVLNVAVTDVDGDPVSLTLTGASLSFFDLSGTTISIKQNIDYETDTCYNIGITASDSVHNTTSALTVKVTNTNDEAPAIHISADNTMFEEYPVGTVIYGLYTVSDPDGPDNFSYTLSNTHADLFTTHSDGYLVIASRIDRETLTNVDLMVTVAVEDSAGNSASADVTIRVQDINDNTPACGQSVFTMELEEAGTESAKMINNTLACTDKDFGNNSDIVLNITSGNDANVFWYDGQELWGSPDQVDYESLDTAGYKFTLVVEAMDTPDDGQRNRGVFIVIVQITGKNEFAPIFTSPLPDGSAHFPDETVSENTEPGSTLLTFVASDDDHGVDGDVHYEIVSVTSAAGASEPNLFKIDGMSGILILSGSLDADTDTGGVAYYSVVVKAVDNGATPQEIQATQKIQLGGVNDNAPVFNNTDFEVFVSEDASVNDIVFELTVTDADGDSVTLSASGGDDTVFGINGNNIVVLATLDFETQTCYYLDISASDGTWSSDISVTIKVSDVNDESPTITKISSPSMVEETAVGTVLYGLYTASDPEVGDTVVYSHGGTDASYFTISASGDLIVGKRVDLEAGISNLSIDLTATDAAGNAVTETLAITVIDVNDHTPSCDKEVYELELEEASGADAKLMDAISCIDVETSTVTLTVAGGDPDGVFRYDGLELWGAADSIDYESLGATGYKYYLSVAVTDEPTATPANTGHILVIVKVTGKNEHTPAWGSASLDGTGSLLGVVVSEDAVVGTTVTTLVAEDDDQGLDGQVSFELVSVTSDTGASVLDKFWLDPGTGDLIIATLLDADSTTGGVIYYDIAVKAVDGNTTPLEVQGTLKVTVNAVNDNAPNFSDTEFKATVPEDVTPGYNVLTLTLDDVDGDTPTLTVVGTWSSLFEGDGTNILTSDKLDYETEKSYSVQVRASDGVHTTDHFVTIEVTDVSDEPPVLSVYVGVTVAEELPPGVIIGDVFSVTDPDTTDTFTYSLSGSHSSVLEINETTGHLYVLSNIDRDGGVAYLDDLLLTVTDSAGLTDTATFRLDITDINDLTPMFSQAVYSAQATENSANSKLLQLPCTDDDSGINGEVSLSITAADNPDGIFSLTGSDFYANGSLMDYEATASYSITVLCVDSADSATAKTGVTVVQIQVVGENEFEPIWDTPVPDSSEMFTGVSISETDAPGTLIETFSATDQDGGVDGDVTYDIISITSAESTMASGLFKMDKDHGTLTTAVHLDADLDTGGSAYYNVKVRAKDGGSSSREVTGTIRVTVTDVDDNGPTFTEHLFSGTASCSNVVNDVVAKVTVGDADKTVGASIFSLSDSSTLFAVNGSTGDVSLLKAPEILPITDLRQFVVVEAISSSNSNLNDTATVYVKFDYCGSTTAATTATSTTTTKTPAPTCEPGLNTEVIALAALCGLMGTAMGVAVFLNARSMMATKPLPLSSSLPNKGQGDFERPLENSGKMEVEDLTLKDPADQFVFDSLPPYSNVGGRFEQLP
ncbi:protocadherin Fat 4-like [Haliotis cracherodii]|uniref:protocadherin Fat 4-like n=1 Tax=Haliotis cracherodii TaxID=6455 RepID=UPI0039E91DBA